MEDYDGAEKELQSLIYRKNEFNSEIYEIIRKSIVPRYKSFIHHIKDKKIEKTNNKIENAFQKNNVKINKTNIQDNMGCFKTYMSQRSNFE